MKQVLSAIALAAIFLLCLWLAPRSRRTSGSVNYAPDAFRATIASELNSAVLGVDSNGLYRVRFEGLSLPFGYSETQLPTDSVRAYPADFIQVSDRIVKRAGSDTFYQIRDGRMWLYILPR